MARRRCFAIAAVAAFPALSLAGCRDSRAAEPPQSGRVAAGRDSTSAPQRDDLHGNASLILHPEHVQPGLAKPVGLELRNPYEGDASAVATGAKLFVGYNCVDCHGVDGSGAMGPSLADGRWHFGGSPGAIYESIAQGRPDGMPAWGSLIGSSQIWQLTAYVQSLQAGKHVTTENFSGKTVERTGH